MNKKILVITGPTASGKTKLSIQLAKKINASIICADSRIVYKDFDIVSAKPTIEEREGIEHFLIDIVSPLEDFSAGDFVKAASEVIENLEREGKNIIISGGTWFYIKSLLGEFSLLKSSKNEKLRKELENFSNVELWEKLNKLDPIRAQKIHPNNKDKVIRSIEIIEDLKTPVTNAKREENKKYDALWFCPKFEREELYLRINKRVDEMMDLGLFEEWERNSIKYPNSQVLKNTIGYSEFFEFQDRALAIEKIKQYTRNFAKRQMTYFRSNNDIKFVSCVEDILREIDE